MNVITLNEQELQTIQGGDNAELQYNVGYVVGWITHAVQDAYNASANTVTGGNWGPGMIV